MTNSNVQLLTRGIVVSVCLIFASAQASTAQPEADVEQVVVQFLEAISKKDTTAFRATMIPEATVIATFEKEGVPAYGWRQVDADVQMLANAKAEFLERMWAPEIDIDGPVASVWTRYDFYVDGAFSHCGTDAFHVIQTEAGWKISSVVYTIESDKEKCPESPLGPPSF